MSRSLARQAEDKEEEARALAAEVILCIRYISVTYGGGSRPCRRGDFVYPVFLCTPVEVEGLG